MVSVKEAVNKAVEFANGVLDPSRAAALRLEEVEAGKANGGSVWLITLSMPRPTPALQEVAALLGSVPRDYKTFAVDRETGDVLSMKIRELAGAE
jgi:hypothetical protein